MSRPDLPLIFSPRAEDDFADILQYTLETWGEKQVFAYRAVLDKALLTRCAANLALQGGEG